MAICVQCGKRRRGYSSRAHSSYFLCRTCFALGYSLVKAGGIRGTVIVVSKGGLPVGAAAHLMNKHRQRQRAARAKRPGLFEESV
jgi:hypothetical protein